MSKKDEWTIRCSGHNYITLEWNEKFVFCLDNDMMYAEEMIYKIEKRTGVDFRNIKIKGQKEDFTGLRFFYGGWKRDFWGNFPSKDEIEAYIKLKKWKKINKTPAAMPGQQLKRPHCERVRVSQATINR